MIVCLSNLLHVGSSQAGTSPFFFFVESGWNPSLCKPRNMCVLGLSLLVGLALPRRVAANSSSINTGRICLLSFVYVFLSVCPTFSTWTYANQATCACWTCLCLSVWRCPDGWLPTLLPSILVGYVFCLLCMFFCLSALPSARGHTQTKQHVRAGPVSACRSGAAQMGGCQLFFHLLSFSEKGSKNVTSILFFNLRMEMAIFLYKLVLIFLLNKDVQKLLTKNSF